MRQSADELLRIITDNATRDVSEAQSLPPDIYHHPDILQLEKERLFGRGWICVGRTAEMPDPGDYICFDIVDQPVVVIRQKGESIKAFPNVCLHRCSRLLDGRGHISRISCPYHSWTYKLGGQLIGAPFMQRTADFDTADHKLRELRCESWEGFVYVSLDQNAPSIAGQLADLGEIVGDFRMANYAPVYEAMMSGTPTGSAWLKTSWMFIIFVECTRIRSVSTALLKIKRNFFRAAMLSRITMFRTTRGRTVSRHMQPIRGLKAINGCVLT